MGEASLRGVPAPSLWRHGDFVRLWCGSAVSLLGTQVSGVALPLTAVVVLGAGPWEMGVLNAARWLPYRFCCRWMGTYTLAPRKRTKGAVYGLHAVRRRGNTAGRADAAGWPTVALRWLPAAVHRPLSECLLAPPTAR
jgi:hypothetical protein